MLMIDQTELSPTDKRLLRLLADGRFHKTDYLCEELDITKATLRGYIKLLRKKLQPQGLDIFPRIMQYKLHWCLVQRMSRPRRPPGNRPNL